MRCAHAEQLLPLYVHSDLEAGRATAVQAHIQSCERCRQLAEEFAEVGRWVSLHEPPQFGEEVFRGIRRNVLAQIETEAARPGLLQQLSNFFRPRSFATAAAVLLVFVSLLALSLFFERARLVTNDERAAAGTTGATTTQHAPQTDAAGQPAADGSERQQQASQRSVASTSPRRSSPKVLRVSFRFGRASAVETRPRVTRKVDEGDAPGGTTAAARTDDGGAQVSTGSVAQAVTNATPLRLELQTGDPKIRIIWFTSQAAEAR